MLYHYTSFEGFKGIIESSSLWLVSHRQMDDEQDCKYIFDLLDAKYPFIETSGALTIWKEFKQLCLLNYPEPYITCFSSVDDDMSQWDRFADNAEGVCIGFRDGYFGKPKYPSHNMLHKHNLVISNVEYSADKQEEFVDALIQFLVGCRNGSEIDRARAVAVAIAMVAQRGPVFKSHHFSSEREIRLIHTPLKFDIEGKSLEELGYIGEREIRTKNGVYAPYVIFKIQNLQGAISCIITGPRCQKTKEVHDICDNQGLGAVVRQSKIKLKMRVPNPRTAI